MGGWRRNGPTLSALALGRLAGSRSLTTWLRYVAGMATGMPPKGGELHFFILLKRNGFLRPWRDRLIGSRADFRTPRAEAFRLSARVGAR
ncbi:hypothetical protein GGQ91_003768 [Methylobacterium fujisawaense]|uniref:Uncharacterized protein n=1 Tax=Methylobacterium fujisawaense TaxID=107400 RepID=A0ABR6DE52_9HYPH|nr:MULTISPECIES: hypothetical protein [Methylobacterium]MBA9064367.1 hypothetical protein [Methylobacterium fujisawaense]